MHNYALSPVLLLGEFIMKKPLPLFLYCSWPLFIPLFSAGSKEVSTTPSYILQQTVLGLPWSLSMRTGDIVIRNRSGTCESQKVQNVKITIQNVAWDGIFAGLSNGAL